MSAIMGTNAPQGVVARLLRAIGLNQDESQAPKAPWLAAFIGVGLAMLLFGVYRWYQQNYSFNVGLDYFEADFQTYWMRLFYIQIVVIAAIMVIGAPWIWFTRPKDPMAMSPQKELLIYYTILSFAAVGSVILVAVLGLFVEADAAWHQVTVRDTDFTPTHIGLFYFAIPLGAVGAILGVLWMHTRLPYFTNRFSVPLGMIAAAPVLIMPNLGLNEWGHTFFYAEELFAAPIHWGFVTLGWGLFAITGLVLQILARIRQLTALTKQEAAAAYQYGD
jgi:methane/ammonia monooxygenase subunit C